MKSHERIKHLRKNVLKLNQEEFAKKINISRSNLGNIETGQVKLTDRVINDICESYSVNKEWILTGDEPVFSESNDYHVNRLVEIYKTLNEDNRKYLEGYVFRLLEEQNTQQDNEFSEDNDIEAELEAYRKELEAEKKGQSVSPKRAGKSIG